MKIQHALPLKIKQFRFNSFHQRMLKVGTTKFFMKNDYLNEKDVEMSALRNILQAPASGRHN